MHVPDKAISFVSYNIEGTSVLYEHGVAAFLCGFDFVLLVETFCKDKKFPKDLFPSHDVFESPGIKLTDTTIGRLSGGVALLVRRVYSPYIERVMVDHDNIIAVKLSKTLLGLDNDIMYVGVYVPPANSDYYKDTEIENGISIVEQCILDLMEQCGDVDFMVCGDLNARTGSRSPEMNNLPDDLVDWDNASTTPLLRNSKDIVVNSFGKYLLSVCEQFDFSILNGDIDGDEDGNFTCITHNGCSVVDYFLVSRSCQKLCKSLHVVPRPDTIHLPIVLIVEPLVQDHVQPVPPPKNYRQERFVWTHEKEQTFKEALCVEAVRKCFETSLSLLDTDVDTALDKFNEGLLSAGECMKKVSYVTNNYKQPWYCKECVVLKKALRVSLRKFQRSGSEEDRKEYVGKRKEYKNFTRERKRGHKEKILGTLNDCKGDSRAFWKTVKRYTSKKCVQNSITKDEWYDHFSRVFNSHSNGDTVVEAAAATVLNNVDESVGEPGAAGVAECNYQGGEDDGELDCLDGEICRAEVVAAIRSLKNGKAPGPDNVIGEFLKYSGDEIITFLLKLFNVVFESGSFPKAWTEAVIQPLHKKGDVNLADNYRGISLLNISSKLYSFILNQRLSNWIEANGVIEDVQAGFRKGYSTIDHIFTLSALVQKQLVRGKKLYAAFIDFKKAFDLVNRDKLWEVLHKRGVRGRMLMALKGMYALVQAKVRVGGEFTDSFSCPCGLKQGETCSPVLFSLFINELACDVVCKGKHGIQLFPDLFQLLILLFADDVVLLSDTVIGLQNQLNILHDTAQRLGLIVNLQKSNVVVFRNGGPLAAIAKWRYGNDIIQVVSKYKYLGIFLSTRLSFSHSLCDMATRAKKGLIGIFKMMWSVGEHSPSVFFKLFDCQIQPMLMYGAEVWGPIADLSVVEKVHRFALKRFLNTSVRTPSIMVYGETGRYPLRINIYVHCIRYWLKILRMSDQRLPFKAYRMLLNLHEQNKNTWASSICFLLYSYGFGAVWESQGVGNVPAFLKCFKHTLINCWHQEWYTGLMESEGTADDRFSLYRSFKSSLQLSNYLSDMKHIHMRTAFVRFRLGTSALKPHRFRFLKETADFSCPYCNDVYESELHFLLVCPLYRDLRNQYLPEKYYKRPAAFRVTLLLSSVNSKLIFDIASFIYYALQKRQQYENESSES